MPPAILGILWAAVFAVPVILLCRVRLRVKPGRRPASRPAQRPGTHAGRGQPASPVRGLSWPGTGLLLAISIVVLFGIDTLAFYRGRPMMTFGGLVPLIMANRTPWPSASAAGRAANRIVGHIAMAITDTCWTTPRWRSTTRASRSTR
jgi:hypothetical protein